MYGPLLLLTILGIMTAVLFMYLIGVRIGGIRTGAKILALCVLNPIYYVLVLWVYTNVISIPFMMAVIYFGVCMYQEKRRGYWIFACVLEGISSAVGYFIRPTAVIPLIAFVICAVLWAVKCKENVRRLVKYSIVCVIMAALVFSGISKLNDRFFSSVTDENFPVTHWLMMGSHGEGMHNYPDVNYTKSFETKKEKTHATVKKLISHYKEHGQAELVSFFYDKLVFSWSFGDGIEIIPKVSQDLKQTKLHSWIMGNRMDLFRLYCYAFRIANMILILIALWDLLKMKGIDAYQFVFVLSLFGGMLFYCLWRLRVPIQHRSSVLCY